MITLDDYWMGRDQRFVAELTGAIRTNAARLLGKVNALLEIAAEEGVQIAAAPVVASGWRPLFINEATANAAASSRHLTGEAVDVRDDKGRALARWCLSHPDQLEQAGLWMEDPRWTPTWVHLQMVPPRSGNLVFIPSTAPAKVAALVEQGGVA